jgi:hypothetical protein
MESERALRCIRTEMTNKVTNLGAIAHFKITTMDILRKIMVECFVKHSSTFYQGLAAKQ